LSLNKAESIVIGSSTTYLSWAHDVLVGPKVLEIAT